MLPPTLDSFASSQHAKDRALVQTLERIRRELELDKRAWAGFLHLQQKEYEQVTAGALPLSAVALYHLCERLSLDPLTLENGKIDYVALVQSYFGNRSYLNPVYKTMASSRKFTVVNTLDFVEKFRGPHLRVAANRHFQIHSDFWSDWQDPNGERINIRFLSDFWKFLKTRGLSDDDFRAIGFHSIFTHRNTHIGQRLSALGEPKKVYDFMLGEFIWQFEQNHIYKITRLTKDICIFESRSNPDVADALSLKETGSVEGCQFKIGLASSMPAFVGMPRAAVHETHCIHKGDPVCRFYCDYSGFRSTDGTQRRLSLVV